MGRHLSKIESREFDKKVVFSIGILDIAKISKIGNGFSLEIGETFESFHSFEEARVRLREILLEVDGSVVVYDHDSAENDSSEVDFYLSGENLLRIGSFDKYSKIVKFHLMEIDREKILELIGVQK